MVYFDQICNFDIHRFKAYKDGYAVEYYVNWETTVYNNTKQC